MSIDVFHFEGDGILQLESVIFPLVKSTYGTPYEMYEDEILMRAELPKESKVVLDEGMWDECYSDWTCDNPGTVLYIPRTTLNVLKMEIDDTLNSLFVEAIKTIIANVGLELLPDADIDKSVADNICEFVSEGTFY